MKRGIIVCGAAILLSWVVVFTIFPKYSVPAGAMNPTIAPGEYIITNRSKDVRRGSIIAFKYPVQPKTRKCPRQRQFGGVDQDGVPPPRTA